MAIRALSVAEIAARLNMGTEAVRALARRGQLPAPDVEIGATTGRPVRGWMAETIDEWAARRKP